MRLSRPVLAYKMRAAAASLSVFFVFATVLAFVTYRFWYPDYLFWSDGGIQGLRLIYAVDFVLGPVLATVFFHPEKSRPKLVFDLVVIVVIQISAMAWGAYQVYSQRPLAVVYGTQRFISVAPHIMSLQKKTPEDLRVFSDNEPPYVFRRDPVSEQEKWRMYVMLMKYGFHFESQAWLFQPFQSNLERIFERQFGKHEYLRDVMAEEWSRWVAGRPQQAMTDYRFVFFEGRYANAVLIFTKTGDYLGYLDMGTTPIPSIEPDPVSR